MDCQEISTQMGVRKVESKISHRLTPLTEMSKWISGVAIHGTSTVNCSPAAPRSNRKTRTSEAANVSNEIASAHTRLACGEYRGAVSATRNPHNGSRSTTVRRFIEVR